MRNKIIALLGLMVWGIKIYAQTDNSFLVQFPSPEATNLGIVGNLPVNLHTGQASIDISINTGKDKVMPPISLSYNSSGVQPDVHPGWVGNNWTLNAGGVVTRIMNFIPDETETVGFYYTYPAAGSVVLPFFEPMAGSPNTGCWNNICTAADGAPDEFYVNANGLSGRFMVDNTGKFRMMEDPSVKVEIEGPGTFDYPRLYDVLEGATIHPFKGFTITKNDGTKYKFGYVRELIETSCGVVNNQLWGNGYATAWYLAQIIYPNRDTVTYTYTSKVQNRTPSGNDQNYRFFLSPLPDGTYPVWDGNSLIVSRTATFHAYLKSVESSSARLDFYTSTTNELKNGTVDLGNWKRLDSIAVFNKFTAKREKSFAFEYDPSANKRLTLLSLTEKSTALNLPPHEFTYYERPSQSLPPYQSGQTDLWGYFNDNQDSLSLASVVWPEQSMPFYLSLSKAPNPRTMSLGVLTQIKYPTGGSVLFEYEPNDYSYFYDYTFNEGTHYFPVKWKLDEGLSQWILYKFGDPNGNGMVVQFFEITTPTYASISGFGLTGIRNVTLPPGHYDIAALQQFLNIPINTADHVQYHLFYRRWTSSTLTKATGPGLRIKKISHKSSDSAKDVVHEYIYSKDYSKPSFNPGTSSGILGNRPAFVAQPMVGVNGSGLRFSTPQGPVSMTEGSPLGYSEVTEITKDVDGNILGFVTNKYTNFDTKPDDVPQGVGTNYLAVGQRGNRAYERGKLLESITYTDSGQIIKKVTNTYNSSAPTSAISSVTLRPNFLGNNLSGNRWLSDAIYVKTSIYFSKCRLISTTELTFDPTGNNTVEQYSDYAYNQYQLPSVTKSRTSRGKYKKIAYRYPFDISSPVYQTMTQRNILNYPVETISYLDTSITGSTLNTYKPVVFNNDTMFLPDKAYNLEINSPLSAFTMFNGTVKDAHYINPHSEVIKYDNKGNPLEVIDQSGVVTVYLWGYNSQYPVAKIFNSTYSVASTYVTQSVLNNATGVNDDTSLRNHLNSLRNIPNAQVTTYTYRTLTGISSETDPSGKTVYYEYDRFNRLKLIRNQDGHILKSYEYQYQPDAM